VIASSADPVDEAGTLLIGCHVPGHYEAGMKAKVEIE
jgi:uncharacterized cupredoxin-like copper-binding protein